MHFRKLLVITICPSSRPDFQYQTPLPPVEQDLSLTKQPLVVIQLWVTLLYVQGFLALGGRSLAHRTANFFPPLAASLTTFQYPENQISGTRLAGFIQLKTSESLLAGRGLLLPLERQPNAKTITFIVYCLLVFYLVYLSNNSNGSFSCLVLGSCQILYGFF